MSEYLETLVENMLADNVAEKDIQKVIEEVTKKSPLRQGDDVTVTTSGTEGTGTGEIVTGTTTGTTTTQVTPQPVSGVEVKEKVKVEETEEEKCKKLGMCWEPPNCVPCLGQQGEGDPIETEQEFQKAFDIQPKTTYEVQQQEFKKRVEDPNITTAHFVPSSADEGVTVEATDEAPQHIIIPKYNDKLPGFTEAVEWFGGARKQTLGKDTFIGKKEELDKYRWMDQGKQPITNPVVNDYFKNIEDQQNFQNAILNDNIQSKEVLTNHDKYTLPDGKVEYVKKGQDTKDFLFQYPNATLSEKNVKVKEFIYTTNIDGKEVELTPPSIRPENLPSFWETKNYLKINTSREFTKNRGYILAKIVVNKLKDNPNFNIGRFIDDVFDISKYDNAVKTKHIEALKDCIKDELFSHLDKHGLPSKIGPITTMTYYWTPKGKIIKHNDLTKSQMKAANEGSLGWDKVNLSKTKDYLPKHPALLYSVEKFFENWRPFDKFEFNEKDIKALAKLYKKHTSGKSIDKDIEKLINSKIDASGGKVSESCIDKLKRANQDQIVNDSFHHEAKINTGADNPILDKDIYVKDRHRMIEGALDKKHLLWVIGAEVVSSSEGIKYSYGKEFEGVDRRVLKMLRQPYFNWLWKFEWEEGQPVTAVLNLEQYMRLDLNKMIDILDYQLPVHIKVETIDMEKQVHMKFSGPFDKTGYKWDKGEFHFVMEDYDRSTDTYDIIKLISRVASGLALNQHLIDLNNLDFEEIQALDYEEVFNKHIKLKKEELNKINEKINTLRTFYDNKKDESGALYKNESYSYRQKWESGGLIHEKIVHVISKHGALYNKFNEEKLETTKAAKKLYRQIHNLTSKEFQNLPEIPFEIINGIILDLLTEQEKNKLREKKYGKVEDYWIVSSQRVDRNWQIYEEVIHKSKLLQQEANELIPYFEFKSYFIETFLDKTKKFDFEVNPDGTYEDAVIMKHPEDGSDVYVPLRLAVEYTLKDNLIKGELPRILKEYNEVEDLVGKIKTDQYLWGSLMQRDHSYWAKWMDKVSGSIWNPVFGLTWTIGAGIQKTSDFAGWIGNTEFESLTKLSNTIMQQSGVEIEAFNEFYSIYGADQEWELNPLTWFPKLGNLFADHVGLLASIIAGGGPGLAVYLTGRNGASNGWFKWNEAIWVDVLNENGDVISKKKKQTGRILMESLMLAGSEYLIESWLTLPIISKWRTLLTSGGKQEMIKLAFHQQLRKEFGKDFLANAFIREPASELLTQIVHSWILQDGHWLKDWKNIYLDGAGLGVMFAGVPGLKNLLMSQFMSTELAKATAKKAAEVIKLQIEVAELQEERAALKKKKRQQSKDTKRIKEIDAQIKELKKESDSIILELNNEILELEGRVKKLSKRAVMHYIALLNRIAEIKTEAQRIWDDKTNDKVKQEKLKKLKKEFDIADALMQAFLDPDAFGDPSNAFFGNSNNKADIERYKRKAKRKLILEGIKEPTEEQILEEARNIWKNDEIWKDVERIKKAGAGADLTAYQTVEEGVSGVKNIFNKLIREEQDQNKKDSLKEKRDDLIEDIKNGQHGLNIPPYITKGNVIEIVIVDNMVAQDKMEVRTHEQWHTLSLKLFKGDEVALKEFADAVKEFMKKKYPKLHIEMLAEVEKYDIKGKIERGELVHDEVLAWFCEKVAEGKITLKNDANTTVLGSMFLEAIHNATKDKDGNGVGHLKFENNDQIIEMMVGIGRAIKDGLLTTETIQKIEAITVEANIQESIKEMFKMEGEQTQDVVRSSKVVEFYKDYQEADRIANQADKQKAIYNILEEYKGMAIAITERYRYNVEDFNIYRDDIEADLLTSDRGVYGMILSYNPESADYIYDDGAGGTNTVSVIYNKKGIVRVDDVEIEELENADRETVIKYITDNFGEIVKRNQIPLDGYINKYLGVRSSDIVSSVTGKKLGDPYFVRPEPDPDKLDIWDTDFGEDNNGTGFDESFDNITTAVKHGVWRQVLNIAEGDALYEEVKTTVINAFNNVDPNNIVLDGNGDVVSIKNEKAFRKELKTAFEQALIKKIKEITGTQKSAKFKEFLEEEVTIDGVKVSMQRILIDMLAVKNRNNFPELSTHGGTMGVADSLEAQTNDDKSFVTSTTAGNDIWIKNYDLTIQEFVDVFVDGRDTRYKSLINSMANELALDAVFDILPKNWRNHVVHLQDVIKRDQSIKFSSYVSPLGNIIYTRLDKKTAIDDAALQKMKQRVNRLGNVVDEFQNIERVIDLETLEMLVTVFDEKGVEVEFTPFEVAIVVNAFDNGTLPDAKSELFTTFLKQYAEENTNAAGVINDYRNDPTKTPKTEEGRDLLDELWNEFAKIQLRLGPGFNNILDKDKSMFGNHNRYNDVATFKWGPKRTDVDSSGKVKKFSEGNQSGGGYTSYQIKGWEFIPNKGIFRAGNLTSKDPVSEHGAEKVRGRKYKDFITLQAKIKKQGLTDILDPEVLENVRLMNIGFPLFKKIQKILDRKLNRADKIKELNKVDPNTGLSITQEIELANQANKEVAVAVVTEVFRMIGEGEVSAKNGIHWLQMQTNLVGGIRALSSLLYMTIENGSAKDNRLRKAIENGLKNVKVYGEHVEALTVLNTKLTKVLFEYLNFDANGNLTSVNTGYDLEGNINKAFDNFTQLLTDSFEAKEMDGYKIINGVKVGGPTYDGDRTVMMNEENVTNANGESISTIKATQAAQNIVIETTKAREKENEKNEIRENLIANSATVKYNGATVLDFDRTAGESENVVIATSPNNVVRNLDSIQWAEEGETLLEKGWTMDFSDFDKLTNPKTGPVFPYLVKQLLRFGPKKVYILTARGPKSEKVILDFINSQIDVYNEKNNAKVPHLANVVGLGNSTGEAKADWIETNLVFNGINDIVFIDDMRENVEAVDNMMKAYPEGFFKDGGKSILTRASKVNTDNKIIFLLGGPGSGKSNITDQLDLGVNYEILNPDDIMEPLLREAGLSLDQSQYEAGTPERAKWHQIQRLANDKIKSELERLRLEGKGVIMDGTGGSPNVMKQRYEIFTNSGYDIGAIFVNTSLEVAQRRNAIRERKLPENVVKYNWLDVQNNIKGENKINLSYRDLFGDNFFQINTDNLGQFDVLPENFVQDVSNFTMGIIQGVKASKSVTFNEMLERVKGIPKNQKISETEAFMQGKRKGRFQFILNPNANDFEGLLYAFLDKGKLGEKDIEFFRETLIKPFNKANSRIDIRKQRLTTDYQNLKNNTPGIKKTLKEKIIKPNGEPSNFTNEHAIRVYLWVTNGYKVPDLTPKDAKLLSEALKNNPQLLDFARGLEALVDMKEGYLLPSKSWFAETIVTDMYTISNEVGRDRELEEFIKNKNEIFSKDNLHKIELAFGPLFRNALEEMLYKMEYGKPKSYADMGKLEREWLDWVNSSTGAVMFLNMRSATLQTLSILNYIELTGPNNLVAATKAFGNGKQFWDDFGMIWYSDFLVQRRTGRRIDVNMRDLHDHLDKIHGTPMEKAKAAIMWLLEKGFLPTQLADSFAIAFGGASYYRNYVNYHMAEGYSRKDAEELAWEMFEEETVTTQQSTRVDKLGYEQTSILGKFLLNFKVTPMQYVRKIVKATQDLRAGRGSVKQNLATIAYYGVLQNILFVGLQQAVFATLMDEDDEWDKREDKVIKSMLDNIIYGMGLEGVMIVTVKNGIIEFLEQEEKGWNADHAYTILQFANMSPVLGSKLRKIYSAIKGQKLNQDAIENMPWWDMQNPAWSSIASLIEGITNIPTERVHRKLKNIIIATSKSDVYVVKDKTAEKGWRLEETGTPPASAEKFEIAVWQRISLLLGWSPWGINLITKEKLIKDVVKSVKADTKEKAKFEEKKREQEKINEKEQQKEITDNANDNRDDAQKEEIRCIAVSKSSPRCKMPIVPGKKYCTIHEKVPQGDKQATCKGVRTNGESCKNLTYNKSGYCYLHD